MIESFWDSINVLKAKDMTKNSYNVYGNITSQARDSHLFFLESLNQVDRSLRKSGVHGFSVCINAPILAFGMMKSSNSSMKKEVGKGSGIGLSVVYGIVKNHNGAITVCSQPNRGTTIKVLLPVIDEEPIREIETFKELSKGNETVLLIDDEEAIVKMGQQLLERLGYQVEAIRNPIEALERFRSNPNQFDLIITDMTMPHMTGNKLAEEILKIRSDMPIILCTGFSEKINQESAGKIGIRKYIQKPINKRELSIAIREVLDEK